MTAALFFVSCEEDSDEIIDPSFASPTITDLLLSTDTVFTTSSAPVVNLSVSVSVSANDGSPLERVICTAFFPDGTEAGDFALSDNGSAPDSVAGDMRYTGTINVANIQCLLVGVYPVEVVAENTSQLFSNLIASSFRVVNTANQPPVILSTNLPDQVVRPLPGDSTLLTITVNAGDPDGLCDLNGVTFVTERPNGIILPPIPMSNTGNGLFSFSNYVSYSTDSSSYGYFKYTFTARDNSNLLSAPVKDSILFIRPR